MLIPMDCHRDRLDMGANAQPQRPMNPAVIPLLPPPMSRRLRPPHQRAIAQVVKLPAIRTSAAWNVAGKREINRTSAA